MLTFPDLLITKELLVADMIAHAEADEFIRGTYGRDDPTFRGCAVGCSIHTINRVTGSVIAYGDHASLAEATGIPLTLIHLQDYIFENLPEKLAKDWPRRFYAAIPKNVDLTPTVNRIFVRILREIALPSVTKDDWGVKSAIETVCAAIENGKNIEEAARAAADAANAADAARAAYAADAAARAADAAARAANAARAAYGAAYAARGAAYAARGAAYAARGAARAAYKKIATIICDEMAACHS